MSFRWRLWVCRRRHVYVLLARLVIVIFSCLVLFSVFNYRSRCRYEMSTVFGDPVFLHSRSSRCRINLESLGLVQVDVWETLTIDSVERWHPHVQVGGKWGPVNCTAWQKIAVIISYKDRYDQLILLLNRLHTLLQRQMMYYQIFVVEQAGDGVFNKGRLYNTGVLQSLQQDTFNCFIFHDVDLLPEHDGNIYYCDQHVRHLSSAVDEMRYHTMYYNLIGGVVSINRDNYYRVNGYPNIYWGWGGEDDDFSARTEAVGLQITRPPEYIGRYKMVPHSKRPRYGNNYDLLLSWKSRWQDDGIKFVDSLGLKVISRTDHKLYTNITVDVGLPPVNRPDVQVSYQSLFWFLGFFFP